MEDWQRKSENRSFLVGPLFHRPLVRNCLELGPKRGGKVFKIGNVSKARQTGAFCQFPADLHRDLQTIFGILPSDRTELQCNCTGAESCTVRKKPGVVVEVVDELLRECWCVFVTLVHFDDCRWWTVNGWTMMLVIVITVDSQIVKSTATVLQGSVLFRSPQLLKFFPRTGASLTMAISFFCCWSFWSLYSTYIKPFMKKVCERHLEAPKPLC